MASELSRERERFRLEYLSILEKMIARAERRLAKLAACGLTPPDAEEIEREIAECRKDLAFFRRRTPKSKPRRAERVTSK